MYSREGEPKTKLLGPAANQEHQVSVSTLDPYELSFATSVRESAWARRFSPGAGGREGWAERQGSLVSRLAVTRSSRQ